MNNQEAFDKMLNHLRKQKVQSKDDDLDECMYRGPNGTMCAVGVLIPDDEYKVTHEGGSISSIHFEIPSLSNVDKWLLERAQSAHDGCADSEGTLDMPLIESRFEKLAKEFKLTYSPPEGQ